MKTFLRSESKSMFRLVVIATVCLSVIFLPACPRSSPAKMRVESFPSGATIQVASGNRLIPGFTPLTFELRDSDVTKVNGRSAVVLVAQRGGYLTQTVTHYLGSDKLERGKQYYVQITLRRQ